MPCLDALLQAGLASSLCTGPQDDGLTLVAVAMHHEADPRLGCLLEVLAQRLHHIRQPGSSQEDLPDITSGLSWDTVRDVHTGALLCQSAA